MDILGTEQEMLSRAHDVLHDIPIMIVAVCYSDGFIVRIAFSHSDECSLFAFMFLAVDHHIDRSAT